MSNWLRHMPFRTKLTVWWSLAFGLVLAVANAAIYTAFNVYLDRDLDRKVRTVAATELASSTDGPGIHLHELAPEALGNGEFADKFVQIFDADGHVRLASRNVRNLPPLVNTDLVMAAVDGRAPLVSVDVGGRPGRAAVLRTQLSGERYAVLVGVFRDDIDAHLTRLAWVLAIVWGCGLLTTAALGYGLASKALAPVLRISRRAARIAQGDFAVRLDPPEQLDEVGEMTHSLNEVLERLHGALEAHRRFAADASHELRAPLASIAGEIDVALRRPRTAAEFRETLCVVNERVATLRSLCEDLMLLVHAQEGASGLELNEVPLIDHIRHSVTRLAEVASSRGITIHVRELEDLVVYANAPLLARVLDNLVANAVAYNRVGGDVVISGGAVATNADASSIEMASITLTDSGPGIPVDAFDRVFDRFYRVDPARSYGTGGSGLGLAICREVLAAMRGSIRIATSSAAGTTFEIRLPGKVVSGRRFSEPLNLAAFELERQALPTDASA